MVEYTYTEYTPTTHRRRLYFVHLDPSRRRFMVYIYTYTKRNDNIPWTSL